MLTDTEAGLASSKAFLGDCVELTQLMLRETLEAARRGEQVNWRAAREVMREGRAAARQLAQVAALEVRDRALQQQPKEKAEPSDRVIYTMHAGDWVEQVYQQHEREDFDFSQVPFSPELQAMMKRYGFDPADWHSLEKLSMVLFPENIADKLMV